MRHTVTGGYIPPSSRNDQEPIVRSTKEYPKLGPGVSHFHV
jgi:hypothetical protein